MFSGGLSLMDDSLMSVGGGGGEGLLLADEGVMQDNAGEPNQPTPPCPLLPALTRLYTTPAAVRSTSRETVCLTI